MCCMYTVYSGMQEWVIQIPSIPILVSVLVSVLFPSLHLKYFRINFLLLVGYRDAVYTITHINRDIARLRSRKLMLRYSVAVVIDMTHFLSMRVGDVVH